MYCGRFQAPYGEGDDKRRSLVADDHKLAPAPGIDEIDKIRMLPRRHRGLGEYIDFGGCRIEIAAQRFKFVSVICSRIIVRQDPHEFGIAEADDIVWTSIHDELSILLSEFYGEALMSIQRGSTLLLKFESDAAKAASRRYERAQNGGFLSLHNCNDVTRAKSPRKKSKYIFDNDNRFAD